MFFVNTKDEDWEWIDVFLITRVETATPQEAI
jgi:hypothetical protein